MKILEKQMLSENINQIHEFVDMNDSCITKVYENIQNFNNSSLQTLSYENDIKFLGELSFILSVIASIVARPTINVTVEDVILRQDQAPSIQPEHFQKIFQDIQLWKRKEAKMMPEYIHYSQSIDKIETYENCFVAMLINKIDDELNKYYDFYVMQLKTFDRSEKNSLTADEAYAALTKVEKLFKRVKYIKNSYFYKRVSKVKFKLENIKLTNILLHNRLYNYCYKFYLKLKSYSEGAKLTNEFNLYYFFLLLNVLSKNNYVLDPLEEVEDSLTLQKNENFKLPTLVFKKEDFVLTLKKEKNGFLVDIISNQLKKSRNFVSKNYLTFDVDHSFVTTKSLVRTDYFENKKYLNIDSISIRGRSFVNNDNSLEIVDENPAPEAELLERWLAEKTTTAYASKAVYERFCPICKSRDIYHEKNNYNCMHCKSKYTFFKDDDDKESVWFISLGGQVWKNN